MSFPTIQNVSVTINLTSNGVTNLLLASIAFEELGLAHLINAEAEKIQFVLGTLENQTVTTPLTFGSLISIDESVEKMLKLIAKNQVLLEFKLEEIIQPPFVRIFQNTTTVTEQYKGVTITDNVYGFGIEAPAPRICLEMEVSPDNGVTWDYADIPPGPNIPASNNPLFRYTVTNTGNTNVENITVSDDKLGEIGTTASLAPGAFLQWIVEGIWALGQQDNKSTATGSYVGGGGLPLIDIDFAHYVGVANPEIDIENCVSVDNGVTWIAAGTAPGPLLPTGATPLFSYTVTNLGDVGLTNIEVTDDILGLVGTMPALDPGQSFMWIAP